MQYIFGLAGLWWFAWSFLAGDGDLCRDGVMLMAVAIVLDVLRRKGQA